MEFYELKKPLLAAVAIVVIAIAYAMLSGQQSTVTSTMTVSQNQSQGLVPLPEGVSLNRGSNIVYVSQNCTLTFVAGSSSDNTSSYTFNIYGLVNPTLIISTGVKPTILLINADHNIANNVAVYSQIPTVSNNSNMLIKSSWLNPSMDSSYSSTQIALTLSSGTYYYTSTAWLSMNTTQQQMYGTMIFN